MASVAKGGERAEVAEVQADCTENAAARQNGDRDAGGTPGLPCAGGLSYLRGLSFPTEHGTLKAYNEV